MSRPAQVRNNRSTPAGALLPLLSPPPRLLAFAAPPSAPARVAPLRRRNRAQLRPPPGSRRIKSLARPPRPARCGTTPRALKGRDRGGAGGGDSARGQDWRGAVPEGPSAVPGASRYGALTLRLSRDAPAAPGRGSPGALPAVPAGARPCGHPEPPSAGAPRVLPRVAGRLRSPGAPRPPRLFVLGMVPAVLPPGRAAARSVPVPREMLLPEATSVVQDSVKNLGAAFCALCCSGSPAKGPSLAMVILPLPFKFWERQMQKLGLCVCSLCLGLGFSCRSLSTLLLLLSRSSGKENELMLLLFSMA